ncbi:hypothetical protein [Nocardia jinanensis]|uniref:PPE family protein n=1 Tax=Nocardia jinanensis TaxID=382504 RepID=A0A917RUF8_9NOCA|nr:hypothetical protein [Nocardia jinanensis]GGL34276.1 hypothetical protein GCM10011588_56300 [Nocardia jinanensis]
MAQQGQPSTTGAGTDPAYVPDREIFDAYTHQQIWNLAHEVLAPAELSRLADTWGHTATTVETAFDEFARDLTRFSGGWSGQSATAAAQAAAAFVRAGDDAVGVCRIVEQLLSADSAAAESVRAAIPPPPGPYLPDPDPAVEAAAGAQRRTTYNTAAAALTADAQDTMTFGYNPTIPASGDSVPRFTIPVGGERPAGAPSAGSTSPDPSAPSATNPLTDSDPLRTPVGRGTEAPPPAGPSAGPVDGARGAEDGPDGRRTDQSPGTFGAVPGEEHTGPPADKPRPDSDLSAQPTTPEPVSEAAGAPGTNGTAPATATTAPAAGAAVEPPAADSAAVTEPSRAQPATPAATIAGPDPHTVAARAAVPHQRPPGGEVPVGTIGTDATSRHSSSAAPVGGNRGPIISSAPATTQSPLSATGSDPGPSQRPGHPEQVTRSVLPRATTEAARESFGAASTAPDTAAASERSEHPGARTARPAGLPLPTVARPLPPRAPDPERTGPDYLRAPNEDLTTTPPATPPVFGEYTEAEKPDRPEPGGGSR